MEAALVRCSGPCRESLRWVNRYWPDWPWKYAETHKHFAASVYVYVGEYEDVKPGDPKYAKTYDMVSDARRMERSLRSRNYLSLRLKLDVLDDEDHLSVAPRGFTLGLKYLLEAT